MISQGFSRYAPLQVSHMDHDEAKRAVNGITSGFRAGSIVDDFGVCAAAD